MKLTREIIWNIWIMMVDWKPPRNLLEKRWQKVFLSAEGYGGMAGVAKSCKKPTLMSMFVLFCFWKSWTFQYDKDQSVRFSEQFLHAVPIILECFFDISFHGFSYFSHVFCSFCCWSHPGWSSPIQSLQLLHSRGVALMDEPGGRGKGAEVGAPNPVNSGSVMMLVGGGAS